VAGELMAFGYVLIRAATYGGLYYTANFTASGTQPTWTKITTTGLPALTALSWLAVDPFNPRDRQVVLHNPVGNAGELYGRNGGDWSKLIDATIARTATGGASVVEQLTSPWFDPLVEGKLICFFGTQNYKHWIGVSTDYGATWTAFEFYGGVSTQLAEAKSLGAHYWTGANGNVGLPNCRVAYTPNSGGTLKYANNSYAGASVGPPVVVDVKDPTICYTFNLNGSNFDLVRIDGDAASPMTKTVMEANIADQLGGNILRYDSMWVDPYDGAHMRLLSTYDGLANPTLKATTDTWATVSTGAALGYLSPGALTHIQNTGDTTVAIFGSATIGGGTKIAALSTETDYTPEARDGTNAASAPYTDSIPQVGTLAMYGIWVGEQPVTTGVYVYADEQESADSAWATDIADYAKLGSPMGGDRASFRDMPADGYDVYHAEDVHAATPQIHAPWDEASPPGAGYGIISDGTKWEVSSDTIALTGDLHDAVTLDADAAAILDLQGAGGQEIGLDVQNENTVFAGPATAPANEPTFRALVLADLPSIDLDDLADVDVTGAAANDVLKFDGANWVDGRVALDELSDVDVTGADALDILRFNGATWEDGRHNIRKRTTITADTTLDDTYDVVVVDASGGDVTVTLPDAMLHDGLEYAIKRIDDSVNSVTIHPTVNYLVDDSGDYLIDDNGDYLIDDGSTNLEGAADGVEIYQYDAIQVVADSNANSWWII
jgi:hypothetical protein